MKTVAERILEYIDSYVDLEMANGILAMLRDGHKYSEINAKYSLPREDMIPSIKMVYHFPEVTYWSSDRLQKLSQYHASGMPLAAIVLQFPNCSLSKVRTACKGLGLYRMRKSKWDDSMILELRKLYNDRVSQPNMAKYFNLSVDQVRYQLYKQGLKRYEGDDKNLDEDK